MELTDKELFDLIAAHGPWKTPMDAYRAFYLLGKAEGLKRAGEIALAHRGAAERSRRAKKMKVDPAAWPEISAEERGEDIAAEMIAAAIEAAKDA